MFSYHVNELNNKGEPRYAEYEHENEGKLF